MRQRTLPPTPADEPFFVVRAASAGLRHDHHIARHAHAWHQLVYASRGVLTVSTDQGSWVTPPHWAVWVPARQVHEVRCTGVSELRTLYLRPGAGKGLPRLCALVPVPPLLRELILRAADLRLLDRREAEHRALATLVVAGIRAEPTAPHQLNPPVSDRLRELVGDPERAVVTAGSTRQLARSAALGVRTLERRFQAETGLSLGRWRRQARFRQALRALAAGQAVKAVAAECGYRSASAFVAAFRASFGTTPGRYFARR